jgi:hypothetical protein
VCDRSVILTMADFNFRTYRRGEVAARDLLNKLKIFYQMLRPHDREKTQGLIKQCPDRPPHVIRLQRIYCRRRFIAAMDHAILALGIAALFAVFAPVG